MNAGEYIRRRRIEKGLSQRQLAAVSGVSNSEISRIEAGERQNPSPAVLRAISKALAVPYEELLAEAGYLDAGALGAPSALGAPEAPGGSGVPGAAGASETRQTRQASEQFPDWVYKLPADLYEFIREEASRGWPYMRLAKGLRRQDLSPDELEAVIAAWMRAKKRYEKDAGLKK